MSDYKDLTDYVYLRQIVADAAMDTHSDFGLVERKYSRWAARGIAKLTNEKAIRSGKRYSLFNVNKNLNTIALPCDFKEELFIGFIDKCGEKVPFVPNGKIYNKQFIDEIPCDVLCEAKCECCYPKQLCNDLEVTQEEKIIMINDLPYKETITMKLLPSGEYYRIRTYPVWDTVDEEVKYIDEEEIVEKFDVEACGCIKATEENACKLQTACPYAWSCYCTPCSKSSMYRGGYRIFEETGLMQFDSSMVFDQIYMEWRGSLPKKNGQYIVPAVASETLVEYIKNKDIRNKKGVSRTDKDSQLLDYIRERGNLEQATGRIALATLIEGLLVTPKFDHHT